jgi:MFS family permease
MEDFQVEYRKDQTDLLDIFGRRSVFIFAVGIFLIGSVIGGASTSMIMLILARAIQGIGGGGIMGIVYIIMGGKSDLGC